ncbi:MAG: CDP-diacylglycerol--serine O-phosphatidyltransferase [Deltaproteobacteria bacterium]|nr:CDP-diacylglycerol--serine O-phosphatidyltransferase [Deltaproteobacteria bacterium]
MDDLSKENSVEEPVVENRRTGLKKGIYILPNLFTTASMFCGFFSIVHAILGKYTEAAWGIMFAGVFDALDGRIARLTKTQTEFGVEYDSLADVSAFGLAPAILMFTWSLNSIGRLGWASAFLFFACGALRLARFNVQTSSSEKKYFQGLPIPCAAYVLASFVIFLEDAAWDVKVSPYVIMGMTIALALLMVSSVRYRSFKDIDLSKPMSFVVMVVMAVIVFIIASAPEKMMFTFSAIYVFSGFIEELLHLRNRKNFLEKRLAQKENPQPLTLLNVSSQEKKHLR